MKTEFIENTPETEKSYIAHVKYDNQVWIEHSLTSHLQKVGVLSKSFSAVFDSEQWGELAGLWHDLGKFRPRFQTYIRDKSGYERENTHVETNDRPRHSTAGAIHAVEQLGDVYGHILAYLIAGHHAGLPDWFGGLGSLSHRLAESSGQEEYQESLLAAGKADFLSADAPQLPAIAKDRENISLWMRMLFSCLVDADFLDTERFMSAEQADSRGQWPPLFEIQRRFFSAMAKLQSQAAISLINTIRNNVYQQCLAAAEWQQGMFSLTVPTGGGKTLSSLAFALAHAKKYKKKRIIYAIPFTSIIEQNADVFRGFLGDDAVLEHHSNFDSDPEHEISSARLATQNWDAPLIVTTNVQLFESLHASRTSRCRKLHNLIDSVIILDEAQQLPRDFHLPITKIMQQMSDFFGVTWVLCTATQPVLNQETNAFGQVLLPGLNDVREIITNVSDLAKELNSRVNIQLPSLDAPRQTLAELSESVAVEASVLCIVNTRKQARELFQLLPDTKNNIHLSAQMCAHHRTEAITEIKERLEQRKQGSTRPLRVISTQLIEAGVDVDFPVVYRALAGLDSIAQSAGRCNRENKMSKAGHVVVFKPDRPSFGFLKQGEDVTTELIADGKLNDPLAPESFEAYFKLMNAKGNRDKHDIVGLLKAESTSDNPLAIAFRTAAEKFRLIDNTGISIIVPFIRKNQDDSPVHQWLSMLEADASQRWIYKKLQRFTVSLPESVVNQMIKQKGIRMVGQQMVLDDGYYHPLMGVYTSETLLSGDELVF